LNDTHPSLGVAELMRILTDLEGLNWKKAWAIVRRTFAYTNHTVMPEALEKWSVSLLERLLPRHMKIIYDINHSFLKEVEAKWPGDIHKLSKLSIIEEYPEKKVRMAHLAIVGSHCVNGVAALHTELLKSDVFPEFHELYPTKLVNVTNGVTPRRFVFSAAAAAVMYWLISWTHVVHIISWLHQANPGLSKLISKTLKTEEWKTNLDLLTGLRKFAEDSSFQKQWAKVKLKNKVWIIDKKPLLIQRKLIPFSFRNELWTMFAAN